MLRPRSSSSLVGADSLPSPRVLALHGQRRSMVEVGAAAPAKTTANIDLFPILVSAAGSYHGYAFLHSVPAAIGLGIAGWLFPVLTVGIVGGQLALKYFKA